MAPFAFVGGLTKVNKQVWPHTSYLTDELPLPGTENSVLSCPIPFCLVLGEADELLISPHPPKSKHPEEDFLKTD